MFQPEMVESFKEWESDKQTNFVKGLLGEMCHEQHWQIDMALRPYLMRDFISALPEYVSEQILSYLDELSLCRAESVSKRWREIICNGESLLFSSFSHVYKSYFVPFNPFFHLDSGRGRKMCCEILN